MFFSASLLLDASRYNEAGKLKVVKF